MSPERIAYHRGCSFLHQLHPLTKAGWLIAGTVLSFITASPWTVILQVLILMIAFPLAGLRLHKMRGVRVVLSTAVLLGLLQIIFTRHGTTLFKFYQITITDDGVYDGIYITGRFLSVILLSYLFVLTTEPNDLAYALMRAGLPYRYGFTLITALRLVTVFEEEGQIVYKAQLARGVRYDIRRLDRVYLLARQFILPLLISALGKVDALSVSMEGRCFGKYPKRTFLRQTQLTWRDGLALILLLMGVVAASYAKLANGRF